MEQSRLQLQTQSHVSQGAGLVTVAVGGTPVLNGRDLVMAIHFLRSGSPSVQLFYNDASMGISLADHRNKEEIYRIREEQHVKEIAEERERIQQILSALQLPDEALLAVSRTHGDGEPFYLITITRAALPTPAP